MVTCHSVCMCHVQAEKRFGEALTRNKTLRQDIDRLNKEKASFQQVRNACAVPRCTLPDAHILGTQCVVHGGLQTISALLQRVRETRVYVCASVVCV